MQNPPLCCDRTSASLFEPGTEGNMWNGNNIKKHGECSLKRSIPIPICVRCPKYDGCDKPLRHTGKEDNELVNSIIAKEKHMHEILKSLAEIKVTFIKQICKGRRALNV